MLATTMNTEKKLIRTVIVRIWHGTRYLEQFAPSKEWESITKQKTIDAGPFTMDCFNKSA